MESVRKIGDAANHPLEDLLVDGGARAEAGDLAGSDRAQLLQLVMLGLRLRGVIAGGQALADLLADSGDVFGGQHALRTRLSA